MHNLSCGNECYFLPEIRTAIAWISLSVQDIFCCILNTLFKSKIWAKLMNWFKRETTQNNIIRLVKKKEERNKVTLIASPFILWHRPSLPKKAIVRYRFGVQLWTIAVLFSGTVCPAPRPRIIRLPYIRTWDIVKKINDHSGQCYMTTSIIQSHKLDRTILAMGH